MSFLQRIFRRKPRAPTMLSIERPRKLAETPSSSSRAHDFALLDRWSSHPGRGLNPRRVVSAYDTAASGYPADMIDLFEDVLESDGHLRSVIESRRDDVGKRARAIVADGDSPQSIYAAAQLDKALRRANTQELLVHLLSSVAYGYALAEIDWQSVDGLYVPTWFRCVPHRRFVFDDNDVPRLLSERNSTDGEELIPGRWAYMRMPGRVAAASGLMRTCTWWSLFKRMGIRDWVVFAERYGVPFVTGEYADTASDEDKAVLKTAVQSLGKDGSAVFNDACKLVIHSVEKGGKANDVHGALAQYCNAEMSKVVSGATLTTGEGTSTGSYALGRVHEAVAWSRIVGDAESLSEVFVRDISTPFIQYNGIDANPPRLRVDVSQEVDPLTRAQVADIFVNKLGGRLDEEQLARELGFKLPTGTPLPGQRSGA